MRPSSRGVVSALALVLLLASCEPSGAPAQIEARDPELPVGGTLRIAMGDVGPPDPSVEAAAEAAFLDPLGGWFCTPVNCPEFEVLRCCLVRTLYAYEGRSASEGGAVLRPDLAEGPPEVSPDGLTWTFHIRSGLHYAPPLEGTEIHAADLVRAIERSLTPEGYWGALWFSDIQGAREYTKGSASGVSGLEAVNPTTLRVHLTRRVGDLAARFSTPASAPIPPSPADAAARFGAATGHDGSYGRFLVSSGPYMLQGSPALDLSLPAQDQSPLFDFPNDPTITLVRNPSWSPAIDPVRPAYVDRIEIEFGSAEPGEVVPVQRQGFVERVDSGQLDFVFDTNSPEQQVLHYDATADLQDQVHRSTSNTMFPVSINTAVPPLDDIHVRKAVLYAVDRRAMQGIIESVGVPGDVASHLVANGLFGGLLDSYDPYPSAVSSGDLKAAKREMTLSAYDRSGDGICDIRCGPLLFPVPDSPEQATEEACRKGHLIASNLRQIGLKTVVVGEPHCPLGQNHPLMQPPVVTAFLFGQPLPGYLNASAVLGPRPPDQSTGFYNRDAATAATLFFFGKGGPLTAVEVEKAGFILKNTLDSSNRVETCMALIGQLQTRCWAELDQYLMEHVVPAFPWLYPSLVTVTSERVLNFHFAQATALPALDQIALADVSS